MQNHLKNELRNIISGKSQVRFGAIIQTITGYLNYGAKAGATTEELKQVRQQETKKLETFISKNIFWVDNIDFTQYVSEGA